MGAPINVNSYFDKKALQSYAYASLAVTLITNGVGLVYNAATKAIPGEGLTVPVSLIASVVMVLAFAKRETGTRVLQFIVICVLNALLLFHTNMGINTLYNEGSVVVKEGTSAGKPDRLTAEAGVLGALKRLFVPEAPWVHADLPQLGRLQREVAAIEDSLEKIPPPEIIEAKMNLVFAQQDSNVKVISALTEELVSVRARFKASLTEMELQSKTYQETLVQIERNIRADPAGAMREVEALRGEVDVQREAGTKKQELILLRQNEEVKEQQQRELKIQLQQVQQRQFQQQIQQQQQQYIHVHKQLKERVH